VSHLSEMEIERQLVASICSNTRGRAVRKSVWDAVKGCSS